ncbi:uncharacterized protein LOC141607675 [Silene latifolia]|uniref:uncharacterized protein LOC141607675 n=1 Tax=Silene latifolia TaxID=37657 RepID=UPI003D788D16
MEQTSSPHEIASTSESSQGEPGIPQSAEALRTKEVNEIVGIPVLDLGTIVEDDEVSQPKKEADGEWTQVKGKRSSSSSIGPSSKGLLQLTSEDVESELKYWDTAVVCYGVLMFDNKPLVVKPWSETCCLMKEKVKSVPIWLRLCGLPLKFWSRSCLEKLAGLLGKFIKRDGATEDKTRLGYARLLIEVDIGQEFPDKFFFLDEKGKEVCVLVEYEWKPTICSTCKGICHTQDMCRKKDTSVPVTKPSKPGPKPGDKVWRPIQRPSQTAQPATPIVQKTPAPFGGPTFHNSDHIPTVTIIQQISRQEHHSLSTEVSPAKSYAEALSPTKGINGINKQLDVKKFLHQNKVGLYGLVETKVKQQDFDKILNNLGSHWKGINNNSFHSGGRVWVIWIPLFFNVTTLHQSAQNITVQVIVLSTGDGFIFTVVYGFNDDEDRMDLWQDLKYVHDNFPGPWGIGREVTSSEIMEFRECVQYCDLIDIQGMGAFYTWNNKQVLGTRHYSRIDSFLVNPEWMDIYPLAYAHFLPEGLFDHNPVVCYRRQDKASRRPAFRYYNMWSLDSGFQDLVKNNWLPSVQGSLMYQIVTKLKKLKKPLKELKRNHFSDVDKAVGVAQALLDDIQLQIQRTPTDHALTEAELAAADSLRHLCKVQHSFLSQKAKVEWLANGDDNTHFFHNQIRARQVHNSVSSIKGTDGILYSNPSDIEHAFLNYYKELLGTSLPTTPVHAPTVRTGRLVTPDHHAILLAPITSAEVKNSMFSIASSKSPGPDGYSSQFFKDTWGTVGDDITDAVKDFFNSEKLLRELNTTVASAGGE